MTPTCSGCGKYPDELDEYIDASADKNMSPDEYVRKHEGTYNPDNGHFFCTPCYIRARGPSSPKGWKAP